MFSLSLFLSELTTSWEVMDLTSFSFSSRFVNAALRSPPLKTFSDFFGIFSLFC